MARHVRMAQAGLQGVTVPARVLLEVLKDPEVLQRYIDDAKASTRGLERLISLVQSSAHPTAAFVEVERLGLGLTTDAIAIEDRRQPTFGDLTPANAEATALMIRALDLVAGTGPGTPKKED